jgi:hypothetical protein
MNMRKLAIRAGQIKCNRTACLARAAADLGQAEFKTLRKIDPDTMFSTGHGIADRKPRLSLTAMGRLPKVLPATG